MVPFRLSKFAASLSADVVNYVLLQLALFACENVCAHSNAQLASMLAGCSAPPGACWDVVQVKIRV